MELIAPDVAPEPIRPPHLQEEAGLETFGGGQGLEKEGQQLHQIAASGGEIATLEKLRYDKAASEEAIGGKLSPAITQLLHGDPNDPNNPGAIAAIQQAPDSKSAIKAYDDYMKQADSAAKKYASDLSNPYQIGAYNSRALPMMNSFNKTLMSHVDNRINSIYKNSFNSSVDNLITQTSTSWPQALNPKFQKSNYDQLQSSINNYSDHFGLNDDERELLQSKTFSKYNAALINQAQSEHKYDKAQQLFDQNQDKITDPVIRDRLQKMLEDGGVKGKAMQLADGALRASSGSEQKALAQIKENDAASLEARKIVSTKFQQDRQAERNDQDNTFLNVSQRIKQSGLSDPVDIASNISPAEKLGMRDDQYRSILKTGQDVVTSPSKWLDFMQQVKDGTVTKMSRADLESKYLPYMDTTDKKHAEELWVTGRKGPADPKFVHAQTIPQMIDNGLVQEGFINAKDSLNSNDKKVLQKQVHDDVNRDLMNFQMSENRRAKPEEIQTIIDQNILKQIGNRPTGFFTGIGRTIGLSSKPAVSFDQIPDDAKEHIVMKARQLGKAITKEQIENAYTAYQNKDLKGVIQALQ